jgi:hypothetical protein
MIMPERTWTSDSVEYRYGYNSGSERDNEIYGLGNSYTTEFRQLDVRLGRWLSIDPEFQPWQSSYCSMDDNPIINNDVLGDKIDATRKEMRQLRKRDDWKEIKEKYKDNLFKKKEHSLAVRAITDDSKGVTDNLQNAQIQEKTLSGNDSYRKADHLYYNPKESEVFTYDNTTRGQTDNSNNATENRRYNNIKVKRDFLSTDNQNIKSYIGRSSSFTITLDFIQLQPEDYNMINPAQYRLRVDGDPVSLRGVRVFDANNPGPYIGNFRLKMNSKIDAEGIWNVLNNQYDACHGFVIRITVNVKRN